MMRGESSDVPNSVTINSCTKVLHPVDDSEPGSGSNYSLEKFRLYETRARFYLIGSDRNKELFRVLKIDRSEPSELHVSEDPVVYSSQEVSNLLHRIAEGNRATGGLTFVSKVYGIAGCIRFLDSYYLILITKRRQIGCLCGSAIYRIDESQTITIPHVSVQSDTAHSKIELRYRKLLSSVDLTKDFFYSYTYPTMQNLQKNVSSESSDEGNAYDNIFVWNSYLSRAIRSRLNNNLWTVALVHGYFKQDRLSVFGRDFSVTLISRRSRHFAGTRYLKRGVNDRGRVANDVETEQIVVCDDSGSLQGRMSSVVQMRGSIPLFWSQEASRFSPKPDIILQRYDPTYEATKLHFEDLSRRYGDPIIVLNLIKTVEKRPREMMLRREFANAVGYLNQVFPVENHLKFIHWDFHKFAKSKSANVLAVLGAVAMEALDLTGFFYCGKQILVASGNGKQSSGNVCQLQSGVLRTNCIDCLDRTNVAQYAYGLAALGKQLHAIGLTDTTKVGSDSTIASALMVMYQCNGDALAEQYGGSAAHNTVFPDRQGKWKAATQSREFLKSIKRYYSNTYTDGEKQDAINLFLGYFQPQDGKPAIWELDSDYYLHFSKSGNDLFPNKCVQDEQKSIGLPTFFSPVPACREDFSRVKLTSFDKLIERTCSSLKNVRFCHDSDQKSCGVSASSGVAPDAVEVQLKSPNWLFGQRKYEGLGASISHKIETCEVSNVEHMNHVIPENFSCPYWIPFGDYYANEGDILLGNGSTTSVSEVNWHSGLFLSDQDESSDIYKHYADICQGLLTEPFNHDIEKERHYKHLLQVEDTISSADAMIVEHQMEAFLNEYIRVGDSLGGFQKFNLV